MNRYPAPRWLTAVPGYQGRDTPPFFVARALRASSSQPNQRAQLHARRLQLAPGAFGGLARDTGTITAELTPNRSQLLKHTIEPGKFTL
jgi:hypothetical protein